MSLIEKTIGQCLKERVCLTPDKKGVSSDGRYFTWRQADELSDRLAVRFMKFGICRGTHVAIWSFNTPESVFCWLALEKLGAVAVLVNTSYKNGELKNVLADSGAEYLFFGGDDGSGYFEEIMEELEKKQLPLLKKTMRLEDTVFLPELSGEERIALLKTQKSVHPEDTACMIFTSGTTSRPKGVLLSHRSLVNNSREMSAVMKWNESDVMCIAVPLFHCFGITAGILCGIHTGAQLHLLKKFRSLEIMEQVQKEGCTVLNGVPTMFLALVRNPEKNKYRLETLKSGIIAGSAIEPDEYMEICCSLKLKYLQPSYGQTESSPCITITRLDESPEQKSQSSGTVIDDAELRIQCTDEINIQGVKQGEILTRGYHVMKGYFGRPEETAEAIDEEGWLHTGDIGYLDSQHHLHVIGRKKEMIVRGGENISPAEIEQCISHLSQVAQVKVLGIKAEVLQEEVAACIVLRDHAELTGDEVRQQVKRHLADYKVPKYVYFLPELPMTSSGKVCLEELKEMILMKSCQ